jgi:hypothetical protein
MKVLMLVISSDSEPVYAEHRKIWSKYMNSNPYIHCYFIQYRDAPQALEENTFWLQGEESFPDILTKTFHSIDYFLKKDSYDFIVRTNLSSVWNFNVLLENLKTLPTEKVYNGIIGNDKGIVFVSGSGFIMSEDVARGLLQNCQIAQSVRVMDDVDIGYTLNKLGIIPTLGKRTDFYSREMYDKSIYDSSVYHYRIKWNNLNMRYQEAEVMSELLDKFNSKLN